MSKIKTAKEKRDEDEKIAAMLDAPNAENLAPYANGVGNIKSLQGLAGSAKAASLNYISLLAKANLTGSKKRKDFSDNLGRMGMTEKDAAPMISKNRLSVQKEMAAMTAESRKKLVQQVSSAKESIRFMKRDGTMPKNIASSYKVAERAAIWSMVDAMAVGGLATLARQVAAEPHTEQNRMLAACLILKNDTFPREARPFNSFELADLCFKKEADEATQHIQMIEKAAACVENIDLTWPEGKPIDPLTKTNLGLAFGGDSNISNAIEGDNPEHIAAALTSIQKIAGGVAEMNGTGQKKETPLQEFARLQKEAKERLNYLDSPEYKEESWQRILKEAEEMGNAA